MLFGFEKQVDEDGGNCCSTIELPALNLPTDRKGEFAFVRLKEVDDFLLAGDAVGVTQIAIFRRKLES